MNGRITFNPNQCGGRPCIRGMRIRVKDVLDLLAADKSGLKAKLEKIISRQAIPLERFEEGFEKMRSQEAVKVLLTPDPTFEVEALTV